MNVSTGVIKDFDPQLPVKPPPGSQTFATLRDIGLVIGAILLLTAVVAGITYFVRRKQRKRTATGRELENRHRSSHRSHRRRRRRRKSLPQRSNPTLAETGGLPPKRAKDSQSLASLN